MYDMKHLAKFEKLAELAPDAFRSYAALDEAAMKPGTIPAKQKELIAVGVALATQCIYCVEIHGDRARKVGATDRELAETAMIAAALRAGGAMTHATHALK
jgi:AhpD family alkylhydroperoxidase